MGHLFGLERCSVLLASRAGGHQVYLVASFEDPSIRNYPMDLSRYPEIRRAMETGQVVYIPDAQADPALAAVSNQLASRGVKSITVVPMTWGNRVIGTLFLRTDQAGQPVTEDDIEFTRLVAEVTARALRLAYRVEQLQKRAGMPPGSASELQHTALVAFTHRLMGEFLAREKDSLGRRLPETWSKELDRMVGTTLAAISTDDQTGQVA
jgi:transcriptional regulator with GAF, ATPase, and Fis domain